MGFENLDVHNVQSHFSLDMVLLDFLTRKSLISKTVLSGEARTTTALQVIPYNGMHYPRMADKWVVLELSGVEQWRKIASFLENQGGS